MSTNIGVMLDLRIHLCIQIISVFMMKARMYSFLCRNSWRVRQGGAHICTHMERCGNGERSGGDGTPPSHPQPRETNTQEQRGEGSELRGAEAWHGSTRIKRTEGVVQVHKARSEFS